LSLEKEKIKLTRQVGYIDDMTSWIDEGAEVALRFASVKKLVEMLDENNAGLDAQAIEYVKNKMKEGKIKQLNWMRQFGKLALTINGANVVPASEKAEYVNLISQFQSLISSIDTHLKFDEHGRPVSGHSIDLDSDKLRQLVRLQADITTRLHGAASTLLE
jgi:hypothetical protein